MILQQLRDFHFTLTIFAHSPFLCMCVCQMGFMYLNYLGEWAIVETKAVRHILLARTLFVKKKEKTK